MIARMKHIILMVFIFCFSINAEAKKMIYPLPLIAGSADLIVVGEIVAVKGDSYLFKISETLKGKSDKTITVNIFEEWVCDIRFGKPEKGQKLCLFLYKDFSSWNIINGSSGELLITGKSLTANVEKSNKRLSLKEFKNGIKQFCKCFTFTGRLDKRDAKAHFKQICNDKEIASFKALNDFCAWLYKNTKSN